MNRLHLRLLLFFVFATFLIKGNVSLVSAQAGAGITVIPPKFELYGNPNDVVTETIRVKNTSDAPIVFSVLVEDFSSAGEDGNVVLEEGEGDDSFALKKWIELSSKTLTLQPNEEKTFPFTITIPRQAEPGGHYASVLFQVGATDGQPGVTSVQHRVGSLVLLRVSGNVVEQGSVETFKAPIYNRSTPINLSLRVKNDGTTHIRPNGTIVITNMFGKKVDEIPLNSANVFPGAIRKMDTEWDPGNVLGNYTATLVATYGQQGLVLTSATKFTVASPFAMIMVIVGVVAGLVFLISLITGRKRLAAALRVLTSGG